VLLVAVEALYVASLARLLQDEAEQTGCRSTARHHLWQVSLQIVLDLASGTSAACAGDHILLIGRSDAHLGARGRRLEVAHWRPIMVVRFRRCLTQLHVPPLPLAIQLSVRHRVLRGVAV